MKATLNTADFIAALTMTKKAISKKNIHSISQCLKLETTPDGLRVTGSDENNFISVLITADPDSGNTFTGEDTACVPAEFIMRMAEQISDPSISIESQGKEQLIITWSNGKCSVPNITPEEYPIPKEPGNNTITITFPTKDLSAIIKAAKYSCAEDELRPPLTGIRFEIEPEETHAVATDSHELTIIKTKAPAASANTTFILPVPSANLILSACQQADEATLTTDGKRLTVSCGNTDVNSYLIDGKYPDWKKVYPKNNQNILTIDRKLLSSIIKRVLVCANRGSQHIKMRLLPSITGASLEVSASDMGYSTSAMETVEAEYTGEELVVGFNGPRILDIIDKFSSDNVVLQMAGPKNAVLFTPDEREPDEPEISAILMPVSI